jgi:hypothetical protein
MIDSRIFEILMGFKTTNGLKEEFIESWIFLYLYDWTLSLAQEAITSDFRILKSMQDPALDLKIRRISQFNSNAQYEILTAFVKKKYESILPGFELSEQEQGMRNKILDPRSRPYVIYPDDVYDVEKLAEYKNKQSISKKASRQKLFSKLKNRLTREIGVEYLVEIDKGQTCGFETKITEDFHVKTVILVERQIVAECKGFCYRYYQDLYRCGARIRLLHHYPGALNLSCEWLIHQEEDIENALDTIWSCSQAFIEKMREILKPTQSFSI